MLGVLCCDMYCVQCIVLCVEFEFYDPCILTHCLCAVLARWLRVGYALVMGSMFCCIVSWLGCRGWSSTVCCGRSSIPSRTACIRIRTVRHVVLCYIVLCVVWFVSLSIRGTTPSYRPSCLLRLFLSAIGLSAIGHADQRFRRGLVLSCPYHKP